MIGILCIGVLFTVYIAGILMHSDIVDGEIQEYTVNN